MTAFLVAGAVVLLLWVVFNIAAPYAVLLKAERISPGRLPAELLMWKRDRKVQFYMTILRGGYGYSVFSPGLHLVIFDRAFFARASPALIRFVVAHELAHFHQGHHRMRWFAVVTGFVLFPFVRRWLLRMEDAADAEAEYRTGLCRKLFPELR